MDLHDEKKDEMPLNNGVFVTHTKSIFVQKN